jgi:hypothetical protein
LGLYPSFGGASIIRGLRLLSIQCTIHEKKQSDKRTTCVLDYVFHIAFLHLSVLV